MPFWVCPLLWWKIFIIIHVGYAGLASSFYIAILWIPCRIAFCNGIFNFKCDTEKMGMVFFVRFDMQ